MNRGQVSIEYILVVGFAILMLVPLIVVYYDSSSQLNDQITLTQADRIANEIVATADQVYFQGYPTVKTIKVFFPDNIRSVVIDDNYVKISINNYEGNPRYSAANLTGSLGNYEGLHIIRVSAAPDGVEIYDGS